MDPGRLYKSKYLRKKGEVRYNGHSRREFNMARAIAMVDQIDRHIPNLTVRETLEFAHTCQVSLTSARERFFRQH
jgi:ABC-type multidrug transport system ATPase subunit